jgi:hypothetical protein
MQRSTTAAWSESPAHIPDTVDLATDSVYVMEKLQTPILSVLSARKKMLRREQLSQGVLDAMIESLGRMVIEEVIHITIRKHVMHGIFVV